MILQTKKNELNNLIENIGKEKQFIKDIEMSSTYVMRNLLLSPTLASAMDYMPMSPTFKCSNLNLQGDDT
jgi:hypothetical protein